MYDADRPAVDAWWRAIAAALHARGFADAPQALEWPAVLDAHWREPALLLSQTCGYCIVADLEHAVQVVGAFRYIAPGNAGICYRSELVVREEHAADRLEDFEGRIAVYNEADSYSGWHSLRSLVAPLGGVERFFGGTVASGAHRASLAMLQRGQADIAAIDCVTLAGLRRHAPQLVAGLRVIGHTALAPGCPLITSRHTSPADLAALRRALTAVTSDPALEGVRDALFIGGFEACGAQPWERMRATCASTKARETAGG
ncbi:MAG: phosphate transporter substrate-binding protein [Rhizobacter sp.]|nr:phosphate transporter substrate-binding protein [Rhizobacter sp.]